MTRPVSRVGRRHSEQRLADVLAGIAEGQRTDDGPEPDYEAIAEARRDPEADLDRAEEMYEQAIDRRCGE